MAETSYIVSLLGGLEANLKRALKDVFTYLLRDLRWGRGEHETPSKNFAGSFYVATTPTATGTEFSVVHRRGTAPYLLVPVVPLDAVGATLVTLTVTRPADAQRIYLSSPVADATVTFYVEG